ncbi:cytochrome P450 [Streptomyces sp. OF3]|uniref:Cytochrome P450 n=1 Tax=Streptomyces alkaliterrae TaxID=2213162 RepID=A0A7W3ZLV9_9ACTN|nr:cytochrome P450 [Streptomyces alkaliterrae]MBB1252702.1 cytochrome P450 [Streptomyces alkaliterrae]
MNPTFQVPSAGADLISPYALLRGAREHGPVIRAALPGADEFWLVSSYDAVREALTHPDLVKDPEGPEDPEGPADGEGASGGEGSLPPLDELPEATRARLAVPTPDHTALRASVAQYFTPARVGALRERMRADARALLTAAATDGETDLVASFTFPLPFAGICAVLGVPGRDRPRLLDLTREMAPGGSDPDRADGAFMELWHYFRELADRQRKSGPSGDTPTLLAGLVDARHGGHRWSDEECASVCLMLIIAGHEPTANLLGLGALLLTRDGSLIEELRTAPDRLPGFVEELLRYDSPVYPGVFRHVVRDTTLAGVALAAGESVLVAVGAGNRDPGRFPGPDQFDLGRSDVRHLSFGRGPHFCLGAPLARVVAESGFRELVECFPGLRLSDSNRVQWRTEYLRGLLGLPVLLRPLR